MNYSSSTGKQARRLSGIKLHAFEVFLALATLCVLPQVYGQAQPPTPQPSPTPPAAPTPNPSNTSTRVVGVVPAFNVATFDTDTPLTPGQKFHIVWRSTIDPFSLIVPAVKTGIYSGAGLNSGFGGGAEGFFEKYGAALADGASGRFFRGYVYPVLLHEDPRYFRMGEGAKKSRAGYSLSSVFVTRTDAGSSRFNWSKLLGSLNSAALSNAYYPDSNRGVGFTFSGVAFSYLGEAGLNTVKEFWPDIAASRKRKKTALLSGSHSGQTHENF